MSSIDINYLNKLHREKMDDPDFKNLYNDICILIKRVKDLEELVE